MNNQKMNQKSGIAIVAALIISILGAIVWRLVAKYTGYEIGYVAWGIGLAVGITVSYISKTHHNIALSIVAALLALASILGGKYLVYQQEIAFLQDNNHPVRQEEYTINTEADPEFAESVSLEEFIAEVKNLYTDYTYITYLKEEFTTADSQGIRALIMFYIVALIIGFVTVYQGYDMNQNQQKETDKDETHNTSDSEKSA